jgi:hypothetical protein
MYLLEFEAPVAGIMYESSICLARSILDVIGQSAEALRKR